MSFIYSLALVAEYSAANCLDTEPSALLSGSPTPKPSLSHDRTMDASRLSRFGMTCKPLTESHGADVLTWWLEGFPVRTSALQERGQESTEPEAECGDTWLGWLAKFDPASSLWKTAQLSLIGDSGESLVTFPRSGMTRGGLLWELPMSERTTNETGSGFWPTPTRHNAKETNAPSEADRNTPTLAAQVGGALNPMWTEWLMGWPIGHTDLQPSGTAKFQPVLQQPGELLEGLEA